MHRWRAVSFPIVDVAVIADIFPAIVNSPTGMFDGARVLVADSYLWLFTRAGGEPKFVEGVTLVDFNAENALRRGSWSAVDDQGREWQVTAAGGCGCSNPLKRYSPQALLQLVP